MSGLTCTVCRASSADPSASISCARPDCPANQCTTRPAPPEDRANERAQSRLAFWDVLMPALACAFLLVAAVPAHAENCISLTLKTAKYSVTKTQRVATAWRTDLVVNPTTGMHEPKQVPTAWANETVSMGTFYGIAEVIQAMKNDAAPGISYKVSQPATIYAGAVPNVPPGPNAQGWRGICLDTVDDRLLINRPGVR